MAKSGIRKEKDDRFAEAFANQETMRLAGKAGTKKIKVQGRKIQERRNRRTNLLNLPYINYINGTENNFVKISSMPRPTTRAI